MPHNFKRDRIAVELKRRLQVGLVDTQAAHQIIEGDGSVWGRWNFDQLPILHVYEDASAYTYRENRHAKGMYNILMPIQIEYIVAVQNRDEFYTEGRAAINAVQTAIELDDYFHENGGAVDDFGQSASGEQLCDWYAIEVVQAAQVMTDAIDAVLVYNFAFVDKHLGTK